ncbi:methyl-accepting chemotaxis protein [Aromatoleum petrolei]|uniref:HAMP domain-containing protein n=1 Tax=Aromatoleum petrolei TaxID=76116 RepID=A0ABX1MLM8_9RHOO|nr:methyl-accepting chemotaxis protein [Aromatoleum petrolei]NMF88868.1 HAMP domain-containing protein [Aromatoleum petrolei]QTQ37727.1 Putative methyl-accepting chemotaxis protein [Aromatoleum petrolei]
MFRSPAIRTRLIFLVCVLASLLVVIGITGLHGMSGSNDRLKAVYENQTLPLIELGSALDSMHRIRVHVLAAAVNAGNRDMVEEQLRHIPELDATIGAARSAILALPLTPEEKATVMRIDDGWNAYVAVRNQVIETIRGGDRDQASAIMKATGAGEKYNDAVRSLRKLMELKAAATGMQFGQASLEYDEVRQATVSVIVVGLLAALAVAAWIIRSITQPLRAAVAVAERIAGGNLGGAVPAAGRDEIGQLLGALASMQAALSKTVAAIRESSADLNGAAGVLSAASCQVAASSSEQSSAAAAVAAAIEQMTVSIDQVAASASEAETISRHAGNLSDEGGEVIHGAVAEMSNIAQTVSQSSQVIEALEKKSAEISAIVSVIRDISDQTNLLALNAAIEAARAGEQGRGFAVVADEVRKLSERTGESTREIADMIASIQNGTRSAVASMGTGVRQVGQGVTLANQAGQSITGIKSSAAGVVHAVSEISLALKEQSAASNEVAINVARITEMSEENSEATRQTAEAAQRLAQLAGSLELAVGHFSV